MKKKKKTSNRQIQAILTKHFAKNPSKKFNAKELIRTLKINANKDAVNYALEQLAEKGQIISCGHFKYSKTKNAVKAKTKLQTGRIEIIRSGAGFAIMDDMEDDVFIPMKHLNTALNGDTVEIEVRKPNGRRPDGKVIKVIKRKAERFLGTTHIFRKYAVVIPDNKYVPIDINVPFNELKGAEDGDKVVVEITNWKGGRGRMPQGRVTTVLGAEGSSDIAMKGILINQGFDIEFPEEVLLETKGMKLKVNAEELKKRRDFRKVWTITIDPDTAKDFDDALSLEYLENGEYEIGVHIADVTHYVKPGTALDKEAFRRSTSVYLVDRVAPMLPEKLSNGLCSLVPNEDRFTYSAVFKFNKTGTIINRWFGKSIIHSDRRFTYEEAQDVIEGNSKEFAKEIKKLNTVAKKLRRAKFKNGAINFDSDEVKFKLDEDGTPLGVYLKVRKDAHLLVEDFMLLANKEVARYMALKDNGSVPFLYRIHDQPDPDRVSDFADFAKIMGLKMKVDTPEQIAKSYNSIVKKTETDESFKVLQRLAIRTMAKAEYNVDNIGHYGLAFDYYTHFTSPIRRYSDVLVHRILEQNLKTTKKWNKDNLQESCKHISAQERKAMDAERESIKYKQVEYMQDSVGKTFEGRISGMIAKGLFIELVESRAEGMISFDKMNEAFDLETGNYIAKGRRTGKQYRIGDPIRVVITNTDLMERKIDMVEAE